MGPYLCAAVLRPGKAVAADGTLGLLCGLLPLLRAAFPRARFFVRLDGGFATPEIFDVPDAEPQLDDTAGATDPPAQWSSATQGLFLARSVMTTAPGSPRRGEDGACGLYPGVPRA